MELIPSCKKAIETGRCLGCVALESKNYRGNPNCIYSKVPKVEESIRQIKLNLGIIKEGEK